jgi:catechol 2,3-dioxygenase-like lactoylglutathione lyase family enzyme
VAIELAKPALDVGIVTTNFDRMLAFYRDVLGFAALDPIPFPGTGTVQRLVVGESILRLFAVEQAPPATSPNDEFLASTGYRYITLMVKNLHEVLDACLAFGTKVRMGPVEIRPGVFTCQIQDPDGNWIEMMST